MTIRDDIMVVAEAICDAEGYTVNPENVADCVAPAKAAMCKTIERILSVVGSNAMLTYRLGKIANEIEKFYLTEVDAVG